MRLSALFSVTLREAPAEAQSAGQQLLTRAGFVRSLGSGLFAYLPLAHRAMSKIEHILRQEMDAVGDQEIRLPTVQPAELWRATGHAGPARGTLRFQDSRQRDLLGAAPPHAAMLALARNEVRSYRQLPRSVYVIQSEFQDELHPRAGLIGARESITLRVLSLDADEAGMQERYRAHQDAFERIFRRCGLPVTAAGQSASDGAACVFAYLAPAGQDAFVRCDACDYVADQRAATFRKPAAPTEAPQPVKKVATPNARTIEALARFLNLPTHKTAKAVFLVALRDEARECFVFVVIRGDMEVSEAKLMAAVGAHSLRPATEEEIRAVGAEPGYASPVGLDKARNRSALPVIVVADDAVPDSPNLVAGANEHGYHLLNTNYGRDYAAHVVADIALAGDGDACPRCSAPLRTAQGVTVGHAARLSAHDAEAAGVTCLTADGASRPALIGAYDISVSRLLACIAEQHHDDKGLIWPVAVAPCHIHLVALAGREGEGDATARAEALYDVLRAAGMQVLYDDRAESPGVKFADADLIGLPLRITIAPRSLAAGGVEFKRRDRADKILVPLEAAVARARDELARLAAEQDAGD
jgi:prolyl-tRNA synthetase